MSQILMNLINSMPARKQTPELNDDKPPIPIKYVTTIARRRHIDQLSDVLYSGECEGGARNIHGLIEERGSELKFDPNLADTVLVRTIENYSLHKIESLDLETMRWSTIFKSG